MNQYACAITGHRPTRFCFGYNEEDPLCQKLKECLLEDVYKRQASYATKHGETDAYWLSDQANFSCKVAIEQAISAHYRDNRLDTACLLYTSRCV